MAAFGSYNQTRSVPYDKRLIGQQPSFLPSYSTQPYYQTPYYSNSTYPILSYAQLAQYGMSSASSMHPMDRQYQYQQRWNYLNEMQKNYWKQQTDAMALSLYARPFPMNYNAGTIYPFRIKNQFIQYPEFDGFGRQRFSPQRVLNYDRPSNLVYSNWVNVNVANPMNVRRLPPKIRAIFIPSGPILVHQSYADPLGMPPFLFNHISQPLCSLPLPPPLPQMASLCLENDVQQILMQRYANPVAVFPFNPSWQTSQPMVPPSLFPSSQPMVPPSLFPSSQPMVPPSLFPSSQPMVPPPLFPSSQPMVPPSLFPSSQPASIPGGVPIFPSQIPASQIPQFQNSGSPRMYCTCMPQSSSSNNPIPVATTNPNIRPTDSRITPLLGRSIAPPIALNQTRQQYQNPYINEATSIDSWSRKTPPLPVGAILVFDEYMDKNNLSQEYQHFKKSPKRTRRAHKTTGRSITINTNNPNWIKPRKIQPLHEITSTESDVHSRQSFGNSKSVASSRSPHSLSIHESVNPEKTITTSTEKTITISTEKSENFNHEQLPTEASNVNVTNLTATDDTNSHSNSNEKKLNSSSNSDALRDLRLSLAMRDQQLDLPPEVGDNPTKDEEKLEENTNVPTHVPSSFQSKSKNPQPESILERESTRQTFSTFRPSSRTTVTSAKDTNYDSISQISASKTDQQSQRNLSSTETF